MGSSNYDGWSIPFGKCPKIPRCPNLWQNKHHFCKRPQPELTAVLSSSDSEASSPERWPRGPCGTISSRQKLEDQNPAAYDFYVTKSSPPEVGPTYKPRWKIRWRCPCHKHLMFKTCRFCCGFPLASTPTLCRRWIRGRSTCPNCVEDSMQCVYNMLRTLFYKHSFWWLYIYIYIYHIYLYMFHISSNFWYKIYLYNLYIFQYFK